MMHPCFCVQIASPGFELVLSLLLIIFYVINCRILLLFCRTLWLIQCWLKDIPKAVRAQLYGALSYCLRHDDKAVALTATAALNALVHDIDFVASELTPGFDALMEGLFVGLRTTKLADSRQVRLLAREPSNLILHIDSLLDFLVILVVTSCFCKHTSFYAPRIPAPLHSISLRCER